MLIINLKTLFFILNPGTQCCVTVVSCKQYQHADAKKLLKAK